MTPPISERDPALARIVAAALLLRLLLALLTHHFVPVLDESAYLVTAQRWLAEGRYASTFRPPLYPFLIMASLWAGLGTLGVQLLQAVLGAVTVVPVYRIADRNYGRRAAQIAALLVAFNPILLAFATRLWSETLFIALLMFALDWITRAPAMRHWVLAGLALGLASLTRPMIVTFLPLLGAWVLWQAWREGTGWGPWITRFAVLAACCFAVILPWSVRNLRATGSFVLIDSNGAFNFMVGTQPEAAFVNKDDTWMEIYGAVDGEEYKDATERDPARAQRLAMAAARENIAKAPLLFVRKSLWEAGHLWTSDSFLLRHLRNGWFGEPRRLVVAPLTLLSVGFYLVLVAAGLAGLATAPPSPWRALALLLMLHTTALFGLTYALSRYVLPLHAVLAISAGAALAALRPTVAALTSAATPVARRTGFWAATATLLVIWLLDVPRQADMVLHAGAGHPYHYVSAGGNSSRTSEGNVP